MESLAPPLECVLQIRLDMENGVSVRGAIRHYLEGDNNEFRNELCEWMLGFEGGLSSLPGVHSVSRRRLHRTALFELLGRGLNGEPILKALSELETEMIEICHDQLEIHLRRLPILALVPLMLFQVPAFLILLFGPILQDLLGRFG